MKTTRKTTRSHCSFSMLERHEYLIGFREKEPLNTRFLYSVETSAKAKDLYHYLKRTEQKEISITKMPMWPYITDKKD